VWFEEVVFAVWLLFSCAFIFLLQALLRRSGPCVVLTL
jgi:hypothetical protein